MRLLYQLLLLAILLSTAAFLAVGAAIEPMDFETANARGLLTLYEVSFFAGLALSAAAVSVAVVGIVFAVRRGERPAYPVLSGLAGLAFVAFLVVIPTVEGLREREDAEGGRAEREAAQTGHPPAGTANAPQSQSQTNSPWLYPDAIDHAVMVNDLIAKSRTEGSVFRDLRGCRLVASAALAFRVAVSSNSSPLVVEQCLLWGEVERQGKPEWLLVAFYRHPYGPPKGHAEWHVSSVGGGVSSPIALKLFAVRPTEKEVLGFLSSAFRAEGLRLFGFRLVADKRFEDGWAKAVGPLQQTQPSQPEPHGDGPRPAP